MTRTSRHRVFAVAALLAATPVLAACGAGQDANIYRPYHATEAVNAQQNGISVAHAFLLGPDSGAVLPTGSSVPLYLTIVNNGTAPDRLTAVTVDDQSANAAGRITGSLQVSPGQSLDAGKPSPQIFLDDTKAPLRGGESVKLTLRFEQAGDISLNVPVITRSREFATLPPVTGPTPTAPDASPTASPEASPTASPETSPADEEQAGH